MIGTEGKEITFLSGRFCIREQIPLDDIAVSAYAYVCGSSSLRNGVVSSDR
jgi:hypothetical protein